MQLRSYAQFARFASSSLPEATTKTAWQRRSIMNINYHLLFHFYTVLFFTAATKNESNKTHCTVLQGWTIPVSKKTKHKNSTTLLLGVPIAWFGCAYWLWSPYLPCWACCISTCQLLLKSLSLARSPAPSPPEIHRMI